MRRWRDNWSHDLRVRERFLDEARMLWRLDHERIVRVYSLGALGDGRPYLVMAWADGGSLRDRLAAGPMRVGQCLWLLREIAAGVAVLHDHGIVHRDLTPGNILFRSRLTAPSADRSQEHVMIADLGLAKALAAASGLTARAGTPGYMAPEQDDPMAVVDTRADVYGLGRLGITLLGTSNERSAGQVRLRDGVPPGVAAVLRTATARRPADRYPDGAAFAAALDRATGGRPPTATSGAATSGAAAGRTPEVGRLRRIAAVVVIAAAILSASVASNSTGARMRGVTGSVTDRTGQITMLLPDGWHARRAALRGHREPGGRPAPALVVTPEPDRWDVEPAVPGVFVVLSPGLAARTTPAALLAGRRRTTCTAAPVRTARLAEIAWTVARFTSCPQVDAEIVEAAGIAGAAGLVLVQVVPPPGGGPDFVDRVLASLRVRPARSPRS
jgi:hypothetical protein